MSKERLCELMTDYLAGEITQIEHKELQTLIDSDPELARQAQRLQDRWDLMDKAFPSDDRDAIALQRVWSNIGFDRLDGELSDEDLDKAAGGIYKQRYDKDPYKK